MLANKKMPDRRRDYSIHACRQCSLRCSGV